MAKFDENMEQRVWQRVRGEGQRPLQALAAAEKSNAAAYLMLSRMQQGRPKELLRQLYHREQSHSRLLAGMGVLQESGAVSPRPSPPEGNRAETVLRKCYASSVKAAAEYGSRADDPACGPVFARMAREEWENCAMILEILGT